MEGFALGVVAVVLIGVVGNLVGSLLTVDSMAAPSGG